ncbi:MAG: AsmA family protein [Bacteroidetes bacterium]|nr:AsmA family protein [Bacteroidota bacterium]
MNRPARIIFFTFTGIIVFFLLAALLVPFIVENKIKQQIVSELNRQVTVPVEVRGGMKLSLFQHFPNASFTFSDVLIGDRLRKDTHLLRVKEFSFICNILSLFEEEVEFSKVLLQGGEINLYTDESGKNNFEILKEDTTTKTKLALSLRKAEIKDIGLVYLDKSRSINVVLKVKDAELNGNFNQKQFELNTNANLLVYRINTGKEDFLVNKNVGVEMLLAVDKAENKFHFKKGVIEIDDNRFSISGYFASLQKGMDINIQLLSEGKDILKLFQLLPDEYKANLVHAEGSGQYSIVADVKGIFSPTSSPTLNINADLKDSELKLGKYNKLLKKVNATAKYEMDASGKDRLTISNFNCTLNNLPFHFTLRLSNLADPDFDFYANGVMHLSELSTFIPESAAKDFNGAVKFNQFRLRGRKRDFTDIEHSTLNGSGDFTLMQVSLSSRGIVYDNISGKLSYNSNSIEAKDFSIRFLKTDFLFNGNIKNLLAYIYTLADQKKSSVATLNINGKIHTRLFDLTSIIEGFKSASDEKNKSKGKPVNVRDIFNLSGNLDIEIDKFLFRKTVFENIQGNIQAAPALLRINKLNAQTMKGELQGSGLFSFTPDNKLNIQSDLSAINLNITEIFKQCENFGQTTLTDKHLEGNLTTSTSINATWNHYSEFDPKSFTALIELNIHNGRLINFEPIRAASNFIRVDELNDIRFGDLSHTIKIADQRIDIPEFELKTSALNLMISGYHYFNNDVDYHFKINLHKLLAQKFNRRGRDIQYIENDPYEGVNIYLSLAGNLSHPVFKYDKASSRKKLVNDFKKEKENLRQLFNKNSKKVDDVEHKKEEKYFDLNQKPEFFDFDTIND